MIRGLCYVLLLLLLGASISYAVSYNNTIGYAPPIKKSINKTTDRIRIIIEIQNDTGFLLSVPTLNLPITIPSGENAEVPLGIGSIGEPATIFFSAFVPDQLGNHRFGNNERGSWLNANIDMDITEVNGLTVAQNIRETRLTEYFDNFSFVYQGQRFNEIFNTITIVYRLQQCGTNNVRRCPPDTCFYYKSH